MDPQRIADRYDVVRAIGRGGMGTVWLARDTRLGREVAIKQIGEFPGEPATETRRAMREARSAAALNHPNAVSVYDVVDHDGRPWLVMEYVEGQTLADLISREGRLDPRRVAGIGAALASALARAHERGIVHRDVKPGNVLIDRAGRPKISDFGIARGHGDDALTQTGFVSGTPGYLSPELARGADPDAPSDVWALGATLYAAVEGRPPFAPRSNPIALLQEIATRPPEPMEQAGPLAGAISAMMHPDPTQRWDMATAARELGRVAAGEATVALPAAAAAAAATQVLPAAGEPTQALPAAAVGAGLGAAAASGADAAAYDPDRGGAVPTPREEADRGRRWLPALLLALLLLALGGVYLFLRDDPPAGTAVPRSTGTTAATSAEPTPTQEPPATTTAEPPATTTAEPPATTTAEPPAPTTQDVPAVTEQQLAGFIRGYFKDVTRDRDSTWEQLTASMQAAAGGREGYEAFWRTIDSVKVEDLEADPESMTVTAKLVYKRDKGAESTEEKEFTVVQEGERLLIAAERSAG